MYYIHTYIQYIHTYINIIIIIIVVVVIFYQEDKGVQSQAGVLIPESLMGQISVSLNPQPQWFRVLTAMAMQFNATAL